MQQAELFDANFIAGPVNVASVPKLSPFRYPGGKTWFTPYARRWLSPIVRQKYDLTPVRPERYIEPFLGGGSISLLVTFEFPMRDIITVEIDADVSSIWQAILNAEDGEWLQTSFWHTNSQLKMFRRRWAKIQLRYVSVHSRQ